MKRIYAIAGLTMLLSLAARAGNTEEQKDSLGLPGDNLDLSGVLELFKKSNSLEEFEKALNTETNHVNNLDLNGDNDIDYIRVVDYADSNAHAIVLQVPVTAGESQDVAVIELEHPEQESAYLQIAGDEELYGEAYFVEPFEESDDKSPNERAVRVVVNVWGWPCVKFVYAPLYRPWVSPWKWAYYPPWWKPWRPLAWRTHWGHCRVYHMHYHRVHVHRHAVAHRAFHRHRVTSAHVHNRYKDAHTHYKKTHPSAKNQPGSKQKNKVRSQQKNQPKSQPKGKQKTKPGTKQPARGGKK